jgi:hypothetical protein
MGMTIKPSPDGEGGVRRSKIILFFKILLTGSPLSCTILYIW